MTRIDIAIEDITHITYNEVKLTNLKYYNYIPKPKRIIYNLFDRLRTFKCVWLDGDEKPRYSDYYGTWEGYYTTKQLMGDDKLFQYKSGVLEPWYKKAIVTIHKKNNVHTVYFKRNKDALSLIDSVKGQSNKKFKIIYNK